MEDFPDNPNYENDLIALMDDKALFDQIIPTIRKMAAAGGGADSILKRAEPVAASTLVSLLQSDKDETRRQAAKDIMDRASGKPVERNVHLFGDVSKMHDQDLDTQIKQLVSQTGAETLLAEVLREPEPAKMGRPKGKKDSKPRKPKIIDI